ncbi:MAG: DUF501 domain-containing protein [Aeriscardovia sp.]|nr:DUF501 domain-containing protein [Aeriscardovia sp.]
MQANPPLSALPNSSLSKPDAAFCRDLASRLLSLPPSEEEREEVEKGLGRYPEGMVAVGARKGGRILAVVVRPLVRGCPFPTVFYLTDKDLCRRASQLESAGCMKGWAERLEKDEELKVAYGRAHLMYLCFRKEVAKILGDPPYPAPISAGGMPERVKCLHSLLAQSLVMGPGINPIGDETAKEVGAWQG